MWIPTLEEDGGPKYRALVNAIAKAIETGELKVGERLPPQRQLAWKLGINPSTTMQAYREAARRHLIGGEVGRGTYVLEGSKEASLFLIKRQEATGRHIDLSTNLPAIEKGNQDFADTLTALLPSGGLNMAQGYLTPPLIKRAQIAAAKWLALRNIYRLPDNIKLCAGAQQGLFAALLALCRAGEPILVEELTAPGIKAAARQLHLPLHGIRLDRYGIVPEQLDRLIRTTGAKVMVITPTLQNPTGSVMNDARRREIAAIVVKYRLTLIEDDVYGALSQQTPLAAELPDHSLLITSLSKTVEPSLRLGYLAGSTDLMQRIDPEGQLTQWAVSPLSVVIANQWIENGTALNRVNWQKEEVSQRWRLARKTVGNYMTYNDTPSPHIWLSAPSIPSELVELCRDVGVITAPADTFSVGKQHINAIRLSLTAAPSRAELKAVLEAIAGQLAINHRQ
jgi:DNA-binding transcriptional MocR family regulator